MIELLIISPSDSMVYNVPAGYIFADEVFSEAKLYDPLSQSQRLTSDLEHMLRQLAKKYPRQLRVRWLNLWSLGGIWATIRYRVRTFPTVIVNQKHILTNEQLQIQTMQNLIDSILAEQNS